MPRSERTACVAAQAAGAAYVARSTVYHVGRTDKYIEQALTKTGFSVVEVLTPCPTSYGRRNKEGTAVDMMMYQKANSVGVERAQNMTEEELKGKIVTGVFVDKDQNSYLTRYNEVVEKARSTI